MVLLTAVIALVGLALVTFGGAVAPDAGPAKTSPRSLGASRFFMLLPDGKVEITDAQARRVYQWDGQQWNQVELSRGATSAAEMQ